MWKAGRTEPRRSEAGYTYAAVLIVLVVLALGVQAASIPSRTVAQRAAEDELIHRGLSYVRAIESYWRADPEQPAFPPSLEALLDDPREEGRRHIRRLVDPVIADEWRVIRADEGGIAGVAPVSDESPFRQSGFPPGMEASDYDNSIGGWSFVFSPE